MQTAMDRLERFARRPRRLVRVAWAALVIVSVPFAAHQTDNLTGGGFETKGTGSRAVSDSLAGDFPGVQAEQLSVVFDNRKRDPKALAEAIVRVQRDGFKDVDNVRIDPRALDAARA